MTAADTKVGRIAVRELGRRDYVPVWREMQAFAAERAPDTPDELWVVEHPPVYTMGLNGKSEHLLNTGDIPVVPIDRGGQVTYHGPGQMVVYLLLDLPRLGLTVGELVRRMEQAVIDLLAELGVAAERHPGAPGVYVGAAKIAAIGLRVKRGMSYHGISFNVDMDLAPFAGINPCGYRGMPVAQLKDLCDMPERHEVHARLLNHIRSQLGYTG